MPLNMVTRQDIDVGFDPYSRMRYGLSDTILFLHCKTNCEQTSIYSVKIKRVKGGF